jgi:hypothetical protein
MSSLTGSSTSNIDPRILATPTYGSSGTFPLIIADVAKVDTINPNKSANVVITNATLNGTINGSAMSSGNVAEKLVIRDASGNFSAGTITASLNGTANVALFAGVFTGTLSGDVTGNQFATVVSNCARSAIALGTANHVVINSGTGALSSEAQLAASRGGTGQNFSASSGVIKVATGTFSASTIVNADIDAAAGIVDTKLATISTAGKVSDSATSATSSNTVNTIMKRDTSGNTALNQITVNGFTQSMFGSSVYNRITTSSAIATTNATPTTALTYATSTNSGIKALFEIVSFNTTDNTSVGIYVGEYFVKNIGGVLTVTQISYATTLDAGLATSSVALVSSGTSVNVQVTGIAATNISWRGALTIIALI